MDIRTIRSFRIPDAPMPLYMHTVGYNVQKPMNRPEGFSAFQLLFIRRGQGRVQLSDCKEFTLSPMQYLVLPPHVPHEYYSISSEPWEVGYVSFHGNQVEELLKHFNMMLLKPYNLADIHDIWRVLDELWKIGDANLEGAEWKAVRLFYGLLADLNRLTLCEGKSSLKSKLKVNDEFGRKLVAKAAAYLREHVHESVSLANVASTFGYTHQHMNLLFRRHYRLSMHQYLHSVRLNRATEYLKESDRMTIKEIAGLVGMEPSYFIRQFRLTTGMTPAQYRKYKIEPS